MQIGERVKGLRKGLRITQHALAGRTGLRPETISRIERGAVENPETDTLAKLARAFGVKIDELVGGKAAA
jgi:transcriptional regulator with XRE-family HTH domain